MYSLDLISRFGADNTTNNSACLNFPIPFAIKVIRIKTSLGAITFATSLLAIFLILISKKYKDATFRLVIYLMITDILQAVAMCLALIPITVPSPTLPAQVKNGPGWREACTTTGFLLMTTMWMGNIIIIWIVIHLLVLGWRLYRLQVAAAVDTSTNAATPNNSRCKINWEIIGLLFLIIAPFVISAIPFSLPNYMYGNAGLWCWIKMIYSPSSCKDRGFAAESITVPLVFFYGPLLLIVLFSLISMFATIVFVCYGAVRRSGRTVVDKHQRRMKEIMLVLAYPLLYCTVCLVLLTNRVYSITHSATEDTPYLPLWIAHTVADPVRVLLPAIAFLFHPYVWRDLCARKKPSTTTEGQENPDQSNDVNGDENSIEEGDIEDKLLMAHDSGGNKTNYGGCDENLSFVVESK